MVMGLAIGSGAASPSLPSVQVHDKRDHLRNSTSSPSVAPQSGSSSVNAHGLHGHHTSASSSRQTEDPQTAAQRQAAAKLALRKQLEKTLLQVRIVVVVDVVALLHPAADL